MQGTVARERRGHPSLLSRRPKDVEPHLRVEDYVQSQVEEALSQRLLGASPLGDVAHLVLLVTVAAFAWGVARPVVVVPWLLAVVFATVVRAAVRHRLAAGNHPPTHRTKMIRNSVVACGLAWGAGAAVLAPGMPFEYFALIMVVFAGLTAGGTVTLASDPKSFYAFMSALLGPLSLGILANGLTRPHVAAVVLVVLYAATMVVIYQRWHRGLLSQLRESARLRFSEAEAARERGFLDALLTSAPSAIVTLESDGRILGVNPAFEHLFGYAAEQAIGHDLNELIVPEDELNAARFLREHVEGGDGLVTDLVTRRQDGRLLPVRASAARVRGAEDDVRVVMYDDISDMKRAETALHETEEQYRGLVESAPDLVWKLDREGRWTFLNATCERIYGVPASELIGRPIAEQADSLHVERDMAAIRRVLGGDELVDYETVHRAASGEAKHLSFAARPVWDGGGAVIGAQGMARDVSERAAVRDALVHAREEAVRVAEAKSAFLANMSHEIRTPTNGVLGMLELLMDTSLTAEQQRSAELARSSAEDLLHIINDILDFSKIEAGYLDLEEIPYDLTGLVDSTVRLLAPQASERGIELVYHVSPSVPHVVRGDPGRLRQVITNLVSNAVKFTHEGEIVVTAAPIRAAGDADAAVVGFSVRDTGIGIPPDKLQTIFRQFGQADVSTTRRYGGTGLGLAIAQRIVRLMGSELKVSSGEGRGSEFTFVISLAVENQIDDMSPRPVATLKGLRCIVVDDNPTNRRIVRGVLSGAGLSCDEAPGAEEALASMLRAVREGTPYALAIIDTFMPDRDGFQLAVDVRETPELASMRVVMLTSAGQRGDGQRCREIGIAAYLTKPVSRVELLEAVTSVMGDATRRPDNLVTRHSIEETRRRIRVLLAEDNPVNQEVATAMLRRRGHYVHAVENGLEAVDALRQGRYDLVLMDVQMPVMDGLTATREIRASTSLADLPIVALTAHAFSSERARCLAAGMTGYLAKPFKPHELFAAVEGWGLPETTSCSDGADPTRAVDESPVDLEEFRRSMREAGVEDAVDTLLATFLHDAPERMRILALAADAGDAKATEASAHAFKSAARTITAHRLADLLQQLEDAGGVGDFAAAAQLLPKTDEAYREVVECLETALPQAAANG